MKKMRRIMYKEDFEWTDLNSYDLVDNQAELNYLKKCYDEQWIEYEVISKKNLHFNK